MSVLKGFFILIVLLLGLFFGALAIGSGLMLVGAYREMNDVVGTCKKNVEGRICDESGLSWTELEISFVWSLGSFLLIFTGPPSVFLIGSGVYLFKRSRHMNRELRDGKKRYPLD